MVRKGLLKILVPTAILIAFASITIVPSVFAQEDTTKESITLSPAVSKPTVNVSEKTEGKLTVINDGLKDYRFLLYARPFSVKSESYDPDYTEITDRTEAYQWIKFDKTDLNLAAGDRVSIGYTITVPKNASAGGHYAVLFAETQPDEPSSTQVARKKRVGSLVYITVNGEIKQAGSLESWRAPFWQTQSPIKSDIRIKNSGNVHFQVDSKVIYSTVFNKKRFELNQQNLILPGTVRRIETPMQNSPYFGVFKVSGEANFLNKTETLPEKWVILVPPTILFGLLTFCSIVLFGYIVRRKAASSKKIKSKKSGGTKK